MRWTVLPHQTSAVKREHYALFLQSDFLEDLIVSSLQESRVNSNHRPLTSGCKATRQRYGVLLGYTGIVKALRKAR